MPRMRDTESRQRNRLLRMQRHTGSRCPPTHDSGSDRDSHSSCSSYCSHHSSCATRSSYSRTGGSCTSGSSDAPDAPDISNSSGSFGAAVRSLARCRPCHQK